MLIIQISIVAFESAFSANDRTYGWCDDLNLAARSKQPIVIRQYLNDVETLDDLEKDI